MVRAVHSPRGVTRARAALSACLVALAAGCASTTRRGEVPARVEVATTVCPDPGQARARLAAVLAARGAPPGLVVHVEADEQGEPREVRLRVVDAGGEVGVDRSYPLAPADCPSATELLAIGVERYLARLPAWSGPARPDARATVAWSLVAAVSATGLPAGVDGHLGAVVDRRRRHDRVGAGLLVRASWPQAAGPGQLQQTAVLAVARYRRLRGRWHGEAGARGGALVVSGLGFAADRSDVLPWWEGYVAAGRSWRWGSVGLEVAASGLRHRAATSDGSVDVELAQVRLGLALELALVPR